METDPTRMCALLVGLANVTIRGVGELGLSEVLRLADLGDRATEVLGRSHDMARSVPANRGTPRTAGDSGGNIPVQL